VVAVHRVERKTIQFIDRLGGWDRAVPSTLVTVASTPEERHAILKTLVARALALNPDLIDIEHAQDRPPIVGRPLGAGLFLSTASRAGIVALAVAPGPVGTDVEILDFHAEIPWNVLHEEEIRALEALSGYPQAMGFTRIWSLKEAYLKALGVGLKREPSSFTVRFLDGEAATVDDDAVTAEIADARTTWRVISGAWVAISTLVLSRFPAIIREREERSDGERS
jgi:4'-phosphopantetheinyl transferase